MKNIALRLISARAAFGIARKAAALLLLAALSSGPLLRAASSPPDRMTYQGFLVDGDGNPLAPSAAVNYPVVFRIYDSQEGGVLLWAEQQIVTVDKGNFSVVLGEGTEVTGEPNRGLSGIFAGATASERFMGLTVTSGGNNLTLLPRLRLLPAPYAFLASQAVQLINPSTGVPFVSINAGQTIIPGNASFGGSLFWGAASGLTSDNGGSIELGDSTAASVSPYIDFHHGVGVSQDWNMRLINDGDGRLSIHGGRLSFGNTLADTRISLYDNGAATYGLGVQSGQFRLHLDQPGARFSFLNAPAGSELMTVQGNGNVGIGSANPTHRLEVVGGNEIASFVSTGPNAYLRVWDNTGFGNRVEFASRGNGRAAIWSNGDHFNVLQNGRVGIGTTTPGAVLDVRGHVKSARSFTHYAQGANTVFGAQIGNIGNASGTVDYSILAQHRIGASEFNAFSDARIKQVVGQANGEKDLEIIRQLQVKDYYAVDKVADGAELKKGFIAQEVKRLIPEAVTVSKRFVPDIYAVAEGFEHDGGNQQLTVTLAKGHPLKEGEQVQFITDEARLELPVVKVISPRKFVVGKCERKPAELFVYGREVSDFLVLNYDRIFTTGISAMQELHKRMEAKDARIASLERELAGLKKQLAANLESSSQWEARFAALEKIVATVAAHDAPNDGKIALGLAR